MRFVTIARVVVSTILVGAAPAYASIGALTQKSGVAGCVSATSNGGACSTGTVTNPARMTISSDGKNAYLASPGALVVFDRDAMSGTLTQKGGLAGCISDDGSSGQCTDGTAMQSIRNAVVSPDSRHVYVAASGSEAIAIFDRDLASGTLQQKAGANACVSSSGGGCTSASVLGGGVAISSDGRNVYSFSLSGDGISVFDRNPSSGTLTQKAGSAGCLTKTGSGGCTMASGLDGISALALSADDRNLYSVSLVDDAVAIFDRNPSTGALTQKAGVDACISNSASGGCIDGRGMSFLQDIAVSPDGTSVYLASSTGVVILSRTLVNGTLAQLDATDGCVADGGGDGCAPGTALTNTSGLAISADSQSVYVASVSGVAVFDRALATGVLTQKSGAEACITDDGSGGTCSDGVAIDGALDVSVSPDGRQAYALSESSDAISVFDRQHRPCNPELPPTPNSCFYTDTLSGACTAAQAVSGSGGVAVTTDLRNVYKTSSLSDAAAIFLREPASGLLSQPDGTSGCVSETDASCAAGVKLDGAQQVTVSHDGRSLYVGSFQGTLAVFDRDPSAGALFQKAGTLGCISNGGSGGACTSATGMTNLFESAVSPDGRQFYGADAGGNLLVFDRDPASGVLTQKAGAAGCLNNTGILGCTNADALAILIAVALSPDGRHLYAAAAGDDAVSAFSRDPATGVLTQLAGTAKCTNETGSDGCADGRGLDFTITLAVSPDGRNVYSVGSDSDAIAIFDRDLVSGALTQKAGVAGCISESGSGGECTDGRALDGPQSVAVSADGERVFVGTNASRALVIFHRDPATGALTQPSGTAGCLHALGSHGCLDVDVFTSLRWLALSADGSSLYGTSTSIPTLMAMQCTTCGDGAVDANEACDDGNVSDGDLCSSSCSLPPTPTSTPSPTPTPTPAAAVFPNPVGALPGGKACIIGEVAGGTPASLSNLLSYDSTVFSFFDARIRPSLGPGTVFDGMLQHTAPACLGAQCTKRFDVTGSGPFLFPKGGLYTLRFDVAALAPYALYTLTGPPNATIRVTTCSGDCNGDNTLDVGELQACINHFLGKPLCDENLVARQCPSADLDANGQVSIGEVQLCVNHLLNNCQDSI